MPTTLKEFESVWPRIVADLQDHCKGYKLPQQSLDWFTKVLLWTMLQDSHMLTRSSVSQLQHSRWKVQPWNVSCRYCLHPPQ